jgi:hypothetical protein
MLLKEVQCGYQILASLKMQLATRMLIGGASNWRRASNGMCLLLVPQWLQPDIKSATRYVKTHLGFLCNGRRMTLSASPISVIVALASNQIGDAPPYNAPWINF